MIEIDGPQVGYLNRRGPTSLVYKTLGISGKDPVLVAKTLLSTVDKIKEMAPFSVLFWRRRPCINFGEEGNYTGTCRLLVVPDLTQEQWDDLLYVKPEGASMVALV